MTIPKILQTCNISLPSPPGDQQLNRTWKVQKKHRMTDHLQTNCNTKNNNTKHHQSQKHTNHTIANKSNQKKKNFKHSSLHSSIYQITKTKHYINQTQTIFQKNTTNLSRNQLFSILKHITQKFHSELIHAHNPTNISIAQT